ncbi:MAG: hypothetical protein CL840_04030 [Crocinitomicaceae bacterium]|nr:hypothetical protein [Crocinitomicaceae bacterium]|tara:strand:+ start:3278 stop:3832 length:555 start_codon:yes stop_codon:yes gene_type:complete
MDVVFFANAINAVGVFFGLMAHAYISFSQQIRKGHGFYLVSCVLIVVGSYLLSSWPVIALNVGWGLIAFYGFLYASDLKVNEKILGISTRLLWLSLLVGVLAVCVKDYDLAGFSVTSIYILAYALLAAKRFSNIDYIWWCSIGFILLIPHLVMVNQYSVLAGETIGFIIGLFGLVKHYYPAQAK